MYSFIEGVEDIDGEEPDPFFPVFKNGIPIGGDVVLRDGQRIWRPDSEDDDGLTTEEKKNMLKTFDKFWKRRFMGTENPYLFG